MSRPGYVPDINDDVARLAGQVEMLQRQIAGVAAASVRITVDQVWATGAVPQLVTGIAWDQALFSIGGMWDAAAPGRLTMPIDGIYHVGFNLRWSDTNATGLRGAILARGSDSLRLAEDRSGAPNATSGTWLHDDNYVQLAAGDWLVLYPSQSSGVNQSVNAVGITHTSMFARLAVKT